MQGLGGGGLMVTTQAVVDSLGTAVLGAVFATRLAAKLSALLPQGPGAKGSARA